MAATSERMQERSDASTDGGRPLTRQHQRRASVPHPSRAIRLATKGSLSLDRAPLPAKRDRIYGAVMTHGTLLSGRYICFGRQTPVVRTDEWASSIFQHDWSGVLAGRGSGRRCQ